jgi:Tfp pilus assembly protein PilO
MDYKPWDIVSGIAVLALVGVFFVDLMIPKPKLLDSVKKLGEQQMELRLNLERESDKLEGLQQMARNRLWHGSPEQVSPVILQEVNRACTASGVSMARFQPQRSQEAGELNLLGFTFNAEGRFPQVMQMIRSLESSKIRIAVTQANLSSSSEDNDTVRAAIALAVFIEKPKEEKKKPNG